MENGSKISTSYSLNNKQMKQRLFFLLFGLLSGFFPKANNVQISNVSIINNGPGNIQVQFDVSWDNSWRINTGQNNYDGAWVFFKYKTSGGDWVHLNLTGSNNVIPTGAEIFQNPTGINKTGAMIFRSSTNMGVGNISFTAVRLGVISTLPYNIDVKAFAIEMVYVPAPTSRPFFGDGDGTNESAFALHYADNTATTNSVLPMKCDATGNAFDDNELKTDGMYVYSNDTIQTTNPLGSLDPFPTMKALWCMKYEISQAGYRDFLNTLTYDQQTTRTTNAPSSPTGTGALTTAGNARNYIEISIPGISNTQSAVYGCDGNNNNVYDESADGEWVACNFLNWPDVAAFLDWSGLAPMSELQFERICRGASSAGAQPAIFGEYAWGSTSIFASTYNLNNQGLASEIANNASPTLGNAVYASTFSTGPLRVGSFATATSSRETSGASFYGIMEMSGNVEEYCIHFGSVSGRTCRYVPNGDGRLAATGNAQLPVGGAGFWPGMEGNSSIVTANTCSGSCEVSGFAGIRLRGGSISAPSSDLSVSDRSQNFLPTARAKDRGGRGVLYIR